MDYSSRKIRAVSLSGIQPQHDRITASISIGMEALDDKTQFGPKIDMILTIETSQQETIEDIQSRLLEAGAALLDRLSAETSDSLLVKKREWEDYLTKDLDIDLFPKTDG